LILAGHAAVAGAVQGRFETFATLWQRPLFAHSGRRPASGRTLAIWSPIQSGHEVRLWIGTTSWPHRSLSFQCSIAPIGVETPRRMTGTGTSTAPSGPRAKMRTRLRVRTKSST